MSRISNLSQILEDNQTAILISTPANRLYFTEFNSSFGFLIITKSDAIFMTDSRYIEAAGRAVKSGKEIANATVAETKDRGFLKEIFKKLSVTKVLLEGKITVSEYKAFEKDMEGITFEPSDLLDLKIGSMRMVKEQKEIEKIRMASEIAICSFKSIYPEIKIGMSEREIALLLDYAALKNGAEKMSFDTIVVSGKNSALPHGVPSSKKIEFGDFITLDFGCVYEGYCSDMTRTIAVKQASEEMREVYDIVKKSQESALSAVKEGVLCSDVDRVSRDIIASFGYGEYFRHSTGHGVGIDIHESPNFSPFCDKILKSGMVVTVEPGIYLKNRFGVRIEDMVAVTKFGFENFSAFTKELIII